LTEVLRTEIRGLTQLLARYPNSPKLFDTPDTTIQERTACFELLAHRKLIEIISETFTERHEESPSLSDVESDTLRRAFSLVPTDAPVWVVEMLQVVERLSAHIFSSLPESLRAGGYDHDNAERMQAIESAKELLSSIEQIQAFSERVLNQQLQRLVQRWSADIPVTLQIQPTQHLRTTVTAGGHTRRLNKRKGWEKKLKLYRAVQKALKRNPSLKGIGFCAELDKRHAPPLYDWVKSGEWQEGLTWKEAWRKPNLRRKIRRVRQEAQKFSE